MALLENKNIVIMGVANKWSIAWGISDKFIDEGANLIFTYMGDRSKKSLEKLLNEKGYENYLLVECDVTDEENLDNAFSEIGKKYGTIHGLVHSIAHAKKEELAGEYLNTSREGFLMAHNISAYSLVAASQRAVPMMTEGGSIVTLSYLGAERVIKNYNVMGVAKASLEASVRYLSKDVGMKEITVNAISAGPIKTLAAKGVGEFSKLLEVFEERSPMGRLVKTEEVANTALFLCSDLATGITGEVLHVDCGFSVLA